MITTDVRYKKTEVRLEKIEVRGQKSDIRSKISDCFLSSPVYSLTSDLSGIQ
jgi:hypothetical protein